MEFVFIQNTQLKHFMSNDNITGDHILHLLSFSLPAAGSTFQLKKLN